MTGRTPGAPPEPDEQRPSAVPPQVPAGFGPPPAPFDQRRGGPAGRRTTGRRRAAVIAGLTAALLVVGAGVYLAVRGGGAAGEDPAAAPSGTPSVDQGDGKGPGVGPHVYDPNAGIRPGEARVWLSDNQSEVAGGGASQYGPWRVGDVVVRATAAEFVAHAATDGQERWKLPLQTPVCGLPHAPSADGKLVVGVKESGSERAHCTDLQQIDLTTGKAGWKVRVPAENDQDSALSFEMAIAGDTVAVARTAVMSGFSVSDGRKLFGTSKTNGCTPAAFAGGARLVALRYCFDRGDALAGGRSMVEELDPATGASRWNHTYEKDWTVGRVLSVDPLVVTAHHKDKKTWNITAFAADGRIRSQSTPGFGVSGRCNGFGNSTGHQECYAAAADADTLYLGAGKPAKTLDTEDTHQVVAVDLNTGKEKWRTAEQPKGRTMWPLAVEEGRVVAYVSPGSGQAASVVSLAAADGSAQPVLQSPVVARGAEGVFYAHGIRLAWSGGRVFMVNGRVYSPEPRKTSRAILSFGK
ncbi:PQQ-binding-like beta-propeller repeat protein [Streptomyces erythrochromogenes]|uniref:outer membrane protein assembly factor BamB family protein n=1 Tax=Streptomyces erythrochromogenes TaxID=285574 RepID=UPI0036C4913C